MGNLLNKKELISPIYLRPNGLYSVDRLSKWDPKVMKRFVQDRKVAPFYLGKTDVENEQDEECEICMLYYPGGLNRARCCRKAICTECYFSYRPPNSMATPVDCPFCQRPNFITSFSGPLSEEERKKLEEEEAKVKLLEQKMKLEEIEADRQREEERKKKREEQERQKEEQKQKQKTIYEDGPNPSRGNQDQNTNKRDIDPNPLENLDFTNMTQAEIDDILLNEAIRLSLMSTGTNKVGDGSDTDDEVRVGGQQVQNVIQI